MGTPKEDMQLAHRALAQAVGKVAGMLARGKMNLGELAHAAALAHQGAVTLGHVRNKLIPKDTEKNEEAEQ